MVMHRIILEECVVFTPTTPMNIATGMASIDGGGPGLSLRLVVAPIGQLITNTAVTTVAIHGR